MGEAVTFTLHLNGGPKSGHTVEVAHFGDFYVHVRPYINVSTPLDYEALVMPVTIRTGRYRPRLDGLGQPVPHDLTGAVEADWMMP